MLYAVIVAGGQGTRLWPASRKSSPKHLRPFAGGESLLQRTYNRIAKLIPHERIFVETNMSYAEEFLSQVPELTPERMILEPEAKNNGPAVGLAAAVLHKIDPESVMINVWADHYYDDEDGYLKMLAVGAEAARQNPEYLVGIQAIPSFPSTAYGYLEAGHSMGKVGGFDLFYCKRFVEKPDVETAKQYLASGNYYWNTANFVWRTEAVLDMYKQYAPEMHAGLMRSAESWGTPEWSSRVAREFAAFPSIGFDYLISEKTDKMCFIPARLGWKDVGNWQVVHEMLASIEGQSVISRGKVIALDSENSLIFNENPDKLVAVAGVDDLVIVDTADSLLVMKKSQDQQVKDVVSKIKEMGEQVYL